MIRIVILTLFSLFTAAFCFGQNDWKSGYVITNQGDTLVGLVDNRDSKSNSRICYFRMDDKAKTQSFEPGEIFGYRFTEGKYFISKYLQAIGEDVFLEFVLKGKVNVYHYKETDDRYFVEKDSVIHELKNTKEIQTIKDRQYSVEKSEYKGMLNYLFGDASMYSDIQNTELGTKSLVKVAKKYHNKVCTDEQCIVYEKNISPMEVRFGVYSGISFNSFLFGESLVTNYGMGSFIGSRLQFNNVLQWSEKVSFAADFSLQRFLNYQFKIHDSKLSLDVNLKGVAVKVPLSINYDLLRGNIRPYISVGLVNVFFISQNKDFDYWVFTNRYNRSIPIYQGGIVSRLGSHFMLKNTHSVSIELTHEFTSNMAANRSLQLRNNLFSLSLGYHL